MSRTSRWAGLAVAAAVVAFSGEASAQYKNFTFGFDAGYFMLTEQTLLKPHNFGFGIFGGYKSQDRWWFSGRAMLSFPGQLDNAPNTVVMLHIVPISVRYYFATDAFRPYVGITNSFQLLFNHSTPHDAFWGPGATGGVEIRLKRDLYLGFEGDAYWMFVFEGPDAQIFSATSQLIFFL